MKLISRKFRVNFFRQDCVLQFYDDDVDDENDALGFQTLLVVLTSMSCGLFGFDNKDHK